MKKNITFYDINQINFFKYIPDLLHQLRMEDKHDIVLIYEESTLDKKALEFLKPFNSKKVNLITGLRSCINANTCLLAVNAQRIPDSLLVAYAKKQKIPTLMIQHGMYNGHLKRTPILFINKALKSFKYLIYSLRIGIILRLNPIAISFKFMRTFIKYDSYKLNLASINSIYVDYIHVYGAYWINYHREFFGYNQNTKFEIVGYPELRRNNLNKSVEVCYIAQTIIEDGRGSHEDMMPVLKLLKSISEQHTLVVKRHPRSNNELYKKYDMEITDELPDAQIYIGHYSSLLAVPIALKKKVILIPIRNHSIPDYFQSNAFMCESIEEFETIFKKDLLQSNINEVFAYPITVNDHINLLNKYLI